MSLGPSLLFCACAMTERLGAYSSDAEGEEDCCSLDAAAAD
jgi:hypothetical protein